MRKLYLLVGLAILVPILDIAACGGSDSPGSGGASAGSAGGQVQDFSYSIKVTWLVQGDAPTSAKCTLPDPAGPMDVQVTLSGTEDPASHQQKTAKCADGSLTFSGLDRLRTGATPFVEGLLVNVQGGGSSARVWRLYHGESRHG